VRERRERGSEKEKERGKSEFVDIIFTRST